MARDWIDSPSPTAPTISKSSLILLTILFVFGVVIGMVLRGNSLSSKPVISPILDQGEVIFLFDRLDPMAPLDIPLIHQASLIPSEQIDPQLLSTQVYPSTPEKRKLKSLTAPLPQDLIQSSRSPIQAQREQAQREQIQREQEKREQAQREQEKHEQAQREQEKRAQAQREQEKREQAQREQEKLTQKLIRQKAEQERLAKEIARQKLEKKQLTQSITEQRKKREQTQHEQAKKTQKKRLKDVKKSLNSLSIQLLTPQDPKATFTLQIKAFRNRKEAQKFIDQRLLFKHSKILPYIEEGISKNKPIYRVRLGGFLNKKDALAVRKIYVRYFPSSDRPYAAAIKRKKHLKK